MKPYLTGVDCATDVATVYMFLSHDNIVLHKLGYFSMAVILLHKVTLNICTIHIYRYIYIPVYTSLLRNFPPPTHFRGGGCKIFLKTMFQKCVWGELILVSISFFSNVFQFSGCNPLNFAGASRRITNTPPTPAMKCLCSC